MSGPDHLLIIYPSAGSVFHKELAWRLATACEEHSRGAVLCSSAEVAELDANRLDGETLLIVNPLECSQRLGDRQGFFSRLSAANKRITVLAEAVEIYWFRKQFRLPMRHDLLIDVGFVSQEEKLRDFDVPYRFLFNGPTRQEELKIEQAGSSERHIPWAFVGHYREARLRLATELVERLDPRGFLFLPESGGVKAGQGTISPSGLASVLSRTKYYVWRSHHEFVYYESLRFREAILSGAVPCKVDGEATWERPEIPGIFPSVQALCECIQSEGFTSMWDSVREFYLSRGTLAVHLKGALEDV